MENKGFTLIELLAVIVILAIIALIAIPMISKIIDKTEDSAVLRSAELYIDGVNQAIMRANLNNKFRPKECIIQEDGNLICDGETELKIEATGSKPTAGTLEIEDRRVKSFTGMIIDIYELEMNEDGKIVVTGTLEEPEDKTLEYEKVLNGATPEVYSGLTPVIYESNNWKVVDLTTKWYDYENQEWANAVILKNDITKNVGDIVNVDSEIKGMFVWIPRYEYKIEGQYGTHSDGTVGTQKLPGEIEVNFISKETTVASEGYILHPAFTFGTTQLSGIWVGKFETSTEKTSACYTSASSNNCNNTNQTPYIIPNVSSLRYQTVNNQFITAQVFNTYLDNNSIDFHMTKNSEWGAVAYLSQSKYGKYGNSNYTGADKQVMKNNCLSYITGVGADSQDAEQSSNTCTTNTYETEKGQAASTTGNITGIYDMSGGSWEYVMGVYQKTTENSGFTSTTWPEEKYYDNYTSEIATTACSSGICYGHALSETQWWYGDYAKFVESSAPWFIRGGNCSETTTAGVFDFYGHVGGANSISVSSFRVVLTGV